MPEVLLSGDHGRIAAWRRAEALRRTASRRPDLLPLSAVPGGGELAAAMPADAGELYVLQLACWVQEMHDNPGVEIPALNETSTTCGRGLADWTVLVLRREGRLVGAARGRREGETWDIGRLMVAPDLQGQGLGRFLLAEIEAAAPSDVTSYSLFTGRGERAATSGCTRSAGYRLRGEIEPGVVAAVRSPAADFVVPAALWQTCSSVLVGRRTASGDDPAGLRRAPVTGGLHAAGHLTRLDHQELTASPNPRLTCDTREETT